MSRRFMFPLSTCVLALTLASPVLHSAPRAPVAPQVMEELGGGGSTRVWVHLEGKADLSGAENFLSREERGAFVYQTLKAHADRSQAPLRALLEARGADHRAFWITNAVVVDVDRALLTELASFPGVERITANPLIPMLNDTQVRELEPESTDAVEWNVTETGAPEVWAMGYTGQGVVVAGNDTGVDWDHPALRASYRGTADGRVSHDYNWFDATAGKVEPYDDNGHGTFTVGQMVGEDGANQIGVAPGATWIGCKNMNAAGFGTPEWYTACFEFFIAPTDTAGRNPRPELAPHVVNNSWGCPPSEGCDDATLHDIVLATQEAGVMQVVSAGNSGPSCRTVADPPGNYKEVLSVGAYDRNGSIAGFSSRGPSDFDKSIKPNVSSPGVSVRSAVPGGGYQSGWSGTSMAAPEVAGAIALVWSANPTLMGDIEGTRSVIEGTARPVRSVQCGTSRTEGNNVWGRGKLDAMAAVEAALQ